METAGLLRQTLGVGTSASGVRKANAILDAHSGGVILAKVHSYGHGRLLEFPVAKLLAFL